MIKRALISVYDKEGIVEFAKVLAESDVEIISTGGTHTLLKQNDITVKAVEEVTDFPEVMNGRVKTLHPGIFAGILADRGNNIHIQDLKIHNIRPIDLVVVNLYPFEKTIGNKTVTTDEAIEQIDIGGVSLIRAAAKNFKFVNVITDPEQYAEFVSQFIKTKNNIEISYSMKLAQIAFAATSHYDNAIQSYFSKKISEEITIEDLTLSLSFPSIEKSKTLHLRYGENPHQNAVLIKENFDDIFEVIHGKELSYNNLLDIDAAYNLICEFENDGPACAIIKHGNPSGAAVSTDMQTAYAKAFATDTLSPFGGIIIFNKKIDFKTSIDIDKLFSEIILAPDFDEEALALLRKKKNRRLVKFRFSKDNTEFRKITGGVLYQNKNNHQVVKEDLKFVTKRITDTDETEDMIFAFKIVKHTKSNAIVFVRDKKTLAIGGGQPSRIDSTKIAVTKAKDFGHDLNKSIAASDAFFPFPDGLIEIAKAGAAGIVQPGGSVKDDEVIKAADEYNMAMAFTNIRHFKH
ncbi:MAG: bifunctional phosphoribosylaminoimidazolecarboxamide formyltransferase/IMP cyclohydrolase [bacterium]|nr:bifunctional phosphoribosylaminoimidazolecarboxamide formyltransferase/IMP cyclohydrolase [bacterium]